MIFRARQFQMEFPRPAVVMGIVNVTPDSFSDGGRFFETGAAVDRIHQLVAEGAEIIDIGGESTRPGAQPVGLDEELRRIMPVIGKISGKISALISVDTQKPAVAKAALEAGACIVNDISAAADKPEMWEEVARSGAGYIAMHMRGTPQTMQDNPAYDDVVAEVECFFEKRISHLRAAGIDSDRLALDVGIGFGKQMRHNLSLLGALGGFRRFGRPMTLGASRKSFVGAVLGQPGADRLPGSLACATWAVQQGVQIIRTHDVAETVQAIRLTEAILGHCP